MGDPEARAAWRILLEQALALANAVRDGLSVDRDEGAIFAGLLIRSTPPFPLRSASAQNAAEAFLILARGFVANGWTASTAGFVGAGATCLEAMLTADGHARAAAGRRACGEDG